MAEETKAFYDFGLFSLRISDRVLLAGGRELSLSPKAFELLQFFVANPGALVGREQLKTSVWGTPNVSDNSIDQKIAELRKVFAQVDPGTEYIQNKHGWGWRFVVAVEKRTESVVQAQRKYRSWIAYAAVASGVAITAGAVVKVEGLLASEPRITDSRQITHDGLPKKGRLLTDGRVVYFRENVSHDAESDSRLAAVPVSGGDVGYLQTPGQAGILLDVAARTGDRVYLNRTHDGTLLWRSREGAFEPTGMKSDDASISPDGRTLAYVGARDQLSIRDLGGSSVIAIPVRGYACWLRWSPDGKRIRFSVVGASSLSASLWEVRRDGSNLRRLPIPGGEDKQLWSEGWTADGRYFIFSEYGQLDHRSSLWVVPDDAVSLTRAKPVRLRAPLDFRSAVAAPDGSRIFAIGTNFRNELARFDLKNRVFITEWEGFPAIDVAFPNDGAWAAFARYPDCTLWVSRADGSDRRQITSPGLEAHQPHWSPDGRRIAFMGRMPGKPSQIYMVDASGGVPQLVKPGPLDQGVPSWSSDGGSLVFGELRDRKPDAEMVIRVLDLRTGTETVLPGSKGKWSPRWSPDGRTILAQTTDFKDLELFDCKAQAWKALARADRINDASWSVDGKFVHFEASTAGGQALFRVRVDDGKVEQLALQPEFEYSWSGVAPDGSPLTLRAVKIEEIYALDLKLP
jgi:Tol biopolymer transport system component/DNA-binding winged helix-turn-helix (wHTH) protein